MDFAAAENSAQVFRCQKSAKDIPLARPRCANPTDYCTQRRACPIHALEKEWARGRKGGPSGA